MIAAAHVTQWAKRAPWPTREQIEQDLVLSRLIAEIANHPLPGLSSASPTGSTRRGGAVEPT